MGEKAPRECDDFALALPIQRLDGKHASRQGGIVGIQKGFEFRLRFRRTQNKNLLHSGKRRRHLPEIVRLVVQMTAADSARLVMDAVWTVALDQRMAHIVMSEAINIRYAMIDPNHGMKMGQVRS